MRLFPYQSFYCIVKIIFAIALLQFVAANVVAAAVLISDKGNVNFNSDSNTVSKAVTHSSSRTKSKTIHNSYLQLALYSSTHLSIDREALFITVEQKNVEGSLVIPEHKNMLGVDKSNQSADLCEECKCHGGHIIFVSVLNVAVSLSLTLPANSLNSQYWPPEILVHEKPPIV